MITVYTPQDPLFNYAEVEEMYNENKDKIGDGNFEDVIKRTQFYAFYITQTKELIGCAYYFKRGRRRFVNAFAGRKHHLLNLECFKESLKWFKSNIYAEINNKCSLLGALRCGFKKVKNNLYIYRRK